MVIGKKANGGKKAKLVSVYLPLEVFGKLSEKAQMEERPISKTAARILADALRNE